MQESRAVLEWASFLTFAPLLSLAPRGDRHPVLVLPPFGVDDSYMMPMRWVLRRHGYMVHRWGLGRNLYRIPEVAEGLPRRLMELYEQHGVKLSLVGHSAGGLLARELAREVPHAVRQVITLGAPLRRRPADRSNVTLLSRILLQGRTLLPEPEEVFLEEEQRRPLTVPATSLYSRTDGAVRWILCLHSNGSLRENIEVIGSHSGLAYNPSALFAVLDRLAQPDGPRQPFVPPPAIRHLYPQPEYWRPPAPR